MGNKANKKTDAKYKDIHSVEETYNFSKKEWRVQRYGKIFLAVFILIGLLGLFGGGLLSKRVIIEKDYKIKYQLIVREESPHKLYVYLQNPSDTTTISFNTSYLEDVQLSQTMPPPASAKTTDERIFYSFNTASTGVIIFYLLPDNAGFKDLYLQIGNERQHLEQFIYF